jgi:hypothetical protein
MSLPLFQESDGTVACVPVEEERQTGPLRVEGEALLTDEESPVQPFMAAVSVCPGTLPPITSMPAVSTSVATLSTRTFYNRPHISPNGGAMIVNLV